MPKANQELEANIFAMALLMPEPFVRAEVAKLERGLDLAEDEALRILAKRFGVSLMTMALRLVQIYPELQRFCR